MCCNAGRASFSARQPSVAWQLPRPAQRTYFGPAGIDWTKKALDWTKPERKWASPNWPGLDWTGLDWTGLDWTGLDWTGLARGDHGDGLGWNELDESKRTRLARHDEMRVGVRVGIHVFYSSPGPPGEHMKWLD
eukprot:scaffold500522_cov18-Prasinocladus_malaysianus.AAC.1